MSAYPSTPWGDTAFHLRNAARSLEVAAAEASTPAERALAQRMFRAVEGAHRRAAETALATEPEPIADLMEAT